MTFDPPSPHSQDKGAVGSVCRETASLKAKSTCVCICVHSQTMSKHVLPLQVCERGRVLTCACVRTGVCPCMSTPRHLSKTQ